MKALTEKEIDYLESLIPELVVNASRQAYVATLAAGHSVMEVVDGQVVLTQPSGARQVIREARPKTRVKVGVTHKVSRSSTFR